MTFLPISFSKKEKRTVILAVTIGNLVEWYEIYLYVYWAPIISKLFFNSPSELVNLTHTFLVFAIGFLARPLGGIFFGRLGDRLGRKKSLILSMVMMTIPTFITGLLPTYEMIGFAAPLLLVILRISQSFPAGGELPGAFCYLYESSHLPERRYMCSWGAFGFQLGILISTLECLLLEKYLPFESLVTWGWRVSFFLGGLIGLCGLFLRAKLHETPLYKEMLTHEKIVKTPIFEVIAKYKKGIFMGVLFCALNSSTFYLLTVNLPTYIGQVVGTNYSNNLIYTSFILILITFPLPFFGKLADKWDNKKMLLFSTVGMMALLYPIYTALAHVSVVLLGVIIVVFCLLFTCLSALIPYIMPDLFPTKVRFTCVGLSFNLVDAIIGGFTPVIAISLFHFSGNQACFCWYILFCGLLSLLGFLMMKDKQNIHSK